jgi:hypothetical protein
VPFDPKDVRSLVVALGLGALGGAAIVQSHHDEAALPRQGGYRSKQRTDLERAAIL